MKKILIIEDDEKLRNELKIFLEKNGYIAFIVEEFDNIIEYILKQNADLLLLDINLPYLDGEYICKEIRKKSNVPIIMVTSRDSEIDELISLNNGADQYVTKPYNIQILLAKIAGLLKRNENIEIFLMIYTFDIIMKIYIPVSILVLYFIGLVILYYRKKSYYNKILHILEDLDQKYLIFELIENTSFIEGKILKQIINEAGKSMVENVNKYKYIQEDYKEYIELWIHEIKMPIATSKMIIENNKTSVTESINEELDKIENYIEQALYYARSNNVEKDYYIRKSNLKEIVNNAILKNKDSLIQNKVIIDLHELQKEVYTDSKWCIFILNQLIQNSIKYSKDKDRKIEIYAKDKKEKTILYIKDNGIGIKKGELTRIFEKGFTGENGRINGKKSTGIGLYLSKKLCDKLGIGLEINSQRDIGTEVKIIFPKNSLIEME